MIGCQLRLDLLPGQTVRGEQLLDLLQVPVIEIPRLRFGIFDFERNEFRGPFQFDVLRQQFPPRPFAREQILILLIRVGNVAFGKRKWFRPGVKYSAADERRACHQKQAEDNQAGQTEPEGIYRLGFIVFF